MSDFKMLVCRGDKHNKFWTYEITNPEPHCHILTSRYGRIGLKGQTSHKAFNYSWQAEDYASKKLYEKTRKGYDSVSEEEYQLLLLQAEVVGSGNKVEEADIVIQSANRRAIKVKPGVLTNPDLKPSFILSIRLRDKKGATEPYDLHIEENAAYLLSRASREKPWQFSEIKMPDGVKRKDVEAAWVWASRARIGPSHRLAPVVEKAQEVIGVTLLD